MNAWMRIGAIVVVAGCTRTRPLVAPPGEPLRVTLAWDAPVDLDLYVTTPSGQTVYYANPRDAFVRDARCGAGAAGGLEEARWRAPAPGRYRVGVDFPNACTDAVDTAVYRVVVDAGARHEEYVGTAERSKREPQVFEVTVP
jgi:hypothetical protein